VPSDPPRHRRAYIDWARGLAVLLMIEAHTFDAWTRPLSRAGRPFAYAIMLGGFAAPLFLWLSGVAVALFGASLMRRLDDRAAVVEAICRRGLEIFILAFLFRLQSFIVTPGGYLVTLFRVDILNIMGPAIVATGLVWGLSSRRETLVAAYATLACALAMATPVLRSSALVDTLPTWIQWYVRPSGEHTTFTLFPWAGFVFAGAACGVLLSQVRDLRSETRVHLAFAAAGAALVGLGFYTAARPSIYPHSSFWTSSPTYFAIRVGVLTAGLAAIYAAARAVEACGGRLPVLERLGRNSLFVYWIHVELVYGYATWPLRRRLPLWGTAVAYVVFCALMYAAIGVRDRLVEGWRARRLRLYNAKNITV
jgi:uncharacterized membrane protein